MAREAKERVIGKHTYIVRTFGAREGGPVLVRVCRILGAGLEGFADTIAQGATSLDQAERAKSRLFAKAQEAEGEAIEAPKGSDGAKLGSGILKAIAAALRGLDPDELFALVDKFARYSDVRLSDGRQPTLSDVLDDHFAGEYDELFGWLIFAIEVNYLGFFTARLAQLNGATAKVETSG